MSQENATLQEDAIEDVVSEEVVDSIDSKASNPRELAMQAIIDSRREELSEEIGEELEATEEITIPEIRSDDSPLNYNGEQWVATIKVDGQELNVPFDDLKSSHQKDKASQKRFEEAAQLSRQLKLREEQLNSYVRHLHENQQKQAPPSDVPENNNDASIIEQYHEALYEDDSEKAASLLKTLTNGREHATQNVEEVVNQALERAFASRRAEQERHEQAKYNMDLDDAVGWFNENHKDIAETPELRAVADNRTVTLMQENPDWTPKQVIEAAADYTRNWISNLANPKDARITRKKNIVKHPRAVSAASSSGDQDMEPQTPSQIIDEMKRQRGQI